MMKAKDIIFAWVPNNHIAHVGRIIGHNGDMRLLSGAGLKGWQCIAKWVPVSQLRPLSECDGLGRTFDSHTMKTQRQLKRKQRRL